LIGHVPVSDEVVDACHPREKEEVAEVRGLALSLKVFVELSDGEPGQDGSDSTGRAAGGPSVGDGAGGSGGGDVDVNGDAGGEASQNGGGGGGGAGCILIRTASGDLPDGADGSNPSVSPSLRALPAHRN
jgi:hypothetical protein